MVNSASMNVFDDGWAHNNILVLEALIGDAVVVSSSIMSEENARLPRLQTLSISGINFDSLRLVTQGTGEYISSYIGIDTAAIETGVFSVPEPSSLLLFSLLALIIFRRKSIKS